jgi:hypothetical protein
VRAHELLERIELEFEPFHLPVPRSTAPLTIDRIRVGSSDFELEGSYGTLNLRTKEVALSFTIVLSQTNIPQWKTFEIYSPLRLKIVEKGYMDIESGQFETHAERFNLGRGLVRNVSVFGGQFGCNASVQLIATIQPTFAGVRGGSKASDV